MGLYTYDDNVLMRKLIRCIVYLITLISFAWFLVFSFMGQTIITGQSMAPMLNAEDVCLVNRLVYDLGNPHRFDVVLFERADTGKSNVKRIIGLPGETVRIADGHVYIDGEVLDSEYTRNVALSGIAENDVVLTDDEYFVIGDNNSSSEDSRFSNIGNVKRKAIRGKLWFKIVPMQEMAFIK